MGETPWRGPAWPGLRRFVDLTDTYDAGLRRLLRRATRVSGVELRAGVHLAVSGPGCETLAMWSCPVQGLGDVVLIIVGDEV